MWRSSRSFVTKSVTNRGYGVEAQRVSEAKGVAVGDEENRKTLERLFGVGTGRYDAEAEYEMRHETDFIREHPQSGERIVGRENMRAMQRAFPGPPAPTLRRIVGSGDVWVVEGHNDYDGDVYQVVGIMEFRDGKIVKETIYYAKPFEAPEWRARWVEKM